MLSNNFLPTVLTACLSLVPLQNCMGQANNANPRGGGNAPKVQLADRLTPLNLSRITFNDDISFLSAPEQALYRKHQAEFFQSLKHLPLKDQQEMKQVYKRVPDIVKIIASCDYQYRTKKEYELRPGTEIYENTKRALYKNLYKKQKTEIPHPRGMWYVVDICNEMIPYRYPLKTFDTKNQSIDDNAKKCGFGYLSKMIDFCNNPDNVGKKYKDCADSRTYDLTLEEMRVFEKIGVRHENAIWQEFKESSWTAVFKLSIFDLAKVDTSNLAPAEYKKWKGN